MDAEMYKRGRALLENEIDAEDPRREGTDVKKHDRNLRIEARFEKLLVTGFEHLWATCEEDRLGRMHQMLDIAELAESFLESKRAEVK